MSSEGATVSRVLAWFGNVFYLRDLCKLVQKFVEKKSACSWFGNSSFICPKTTIMIHLV